MVNVAFDFISLHEKFYSSFSNQFPWLTILSFQWVPVTYNVYWVAACAEKLIINRRNTFTDCNGSWNVFTRSPTWDVFNCNVFKILQSSNSFKTSVWELSERSFPSTFSRSLRLSRNRRRWIDNVYQNSTFHLDVFVMVNASLKKECRYQRHLQQVRQNCGTEIKR